MAKAKRQIKAKLVTFYAINDSEDVVTLEIEIHSPGNSAVTTAVLDGEIIVDKMVGDVPPVPIGRNKDLDKKTLTITTIVTKLTGGASIAEEDITLEGGVKDKTFTLSDKLTGTAKLITNIEFVKI